MPQSALRVQQQRCGAHKGMVSRAGQHRGRQVLAGAFQVCLPVLKLECAAYFPVKQGVGQQGWAALWSEVHAGAF